MHISWQDRVPNTEVLSRAGLPSMYTILRKRRLRWVGHVRRMFDGRIPKDILYGELMSGKRKIGRPHLRFKDVCKRDMKAIGMNIDAWEDIAADRNKWRNTVHVLTRAGEDRIIAAAEAVRARRKERCSSKHSDIQRN